jgi:hypothetical protein
LATQEDLISIFQEIINSTISSNFTVSQALSDVNIASIGGTPKTTVEREVSIVQSCVTCNASNDIASALQKQVTSNLSEKVECGDFLASVQTLAQQKNVTSLASIEVEKFSDL